jgi:hypothetical protein
MAFKKGEPRPKGAGRKRGTKNKASVKREAEVKAAGITPLDYMLKVMRDDGEPQERRDEMAKAAAPYVHPKLAATTLVGKLTVSHEDALAELDE